MSSTALTIVYLTLYVALVSCQNETAESGVEGEGGLVFTVPSSIKPNDDPETTRDIVQKAKNNEISQEMVTNKTRAMVSCETGEILVRINFTEPFRGVGYADFDKSSPCKFFGDGGKYYEMKLPLKGCGTKQPESHFFKNNIILRFHRFLELEEDEVKTVVCRYPPPEAPAPPPPPAIPAKIIDSPPEPAKLTQYEPFFIIAGLLFFALVLAGLGTTSYMTKKQTIKPINTPLPITMITEHDDYVDNQSIVEVEEVDTTQKLVPFPKLSIKTVDDVIITNIHEIETAEDIVHHKQSIPKPHLERHEFDETYITNQDEITEEEILRQQRLERLRSLNRYDCDDTYINNQEVSEDENITSQRLNTIPKIELRTIEDTFITIVDEKVEDKNTTYHKNHDSHYEEFDDYAHEEYQIEEHRRH